MGLRNGDCACISREAASVGGLNSPEPLAQAACRRCPAAASLAHSRASDSHLLMPRNRTPTGSLITSLSQGSIAWQKKCHPYAAGPKRLLHSPLSPPKRHVRVAPTYIMLCCLACATFGAPPGDAAMGPSWTFWPRWWEGVHHQCISCTIQQGARQTGLLPLSACKQQATSVLVVAPARYADVAPVRDLLPPLHLLRLHSRRVSLARRLTCW